MMETIKVACKTCTKEFERVVSGYVLSTIDPDAFECGRCTEDAKWIGFAIKQVEAPMISKQGLPTQSFHTNTKKNI